MLSDTVNRTSPRLHSIKYRYYVCRCSLLTLHDREKLAQPRILVQTSNAKWSKSKIEIDYYWSKLRQTKWAEEQYVSAIRTFCSFVRTSYIVDVFTVYSSTAQHHKHTCNVMITYPHLDSILTIYIIALDVLRRCCIRFN